MCTGKHGQFPEWDSLNTSYSWVDIQENVHLQKIKCLKKKKKKNQNLNMEFMTMGNASTRIRSLCGNSLNPSDDFDPGHTSCLS